MVPDISIGEDNSVEWPRPKSVGTRRPLAFRSVDAPASLLPCRAPRTRHCGHRHIATLRTPGNRLAAPADGQTHLSSLPPSTSLGSGVRW
jgi:hypothetical protein